MHDRFLVSIFVFAASAALSFGQASPKSAPSPNLIEIAAKIPGVGQSGQQKLDAGDIKGAIQDFKQAFEWSEQLAKAYPDNVAYAENLFYYVGRLGAAYGAAGEFQNALSLQKAAADGYRELATGDPSPERKTKAAINLSHLAWYQILHRKPADALQSAQQATGFDPSDPTVRVNLAHALLLNGKSEEAKAIYQAERARQLPTGGTFEEAVLADFDQMNKAGVRDPQIAQIRALYGAKKSGGPGLAGTLLATLIVVGILGFFGGIIGFFFYLERKRVQKIDAITKSLGFTFRKKATEEDRALLANSSLANFGRSHVFSNVMEAPPKEDLAISIFDFSYTTGSGKHRTTTTQTALRMDSPLLKLPAFLLQPESFLTKAFKVVGFNDINFAEYPGFSKKYFLRGQDEAAIRRLFNSDIIQYLEQHEKITIEGSPGRLLIYRHGRRPKPEELEAFLNDGKRIMAMFVQASQAAAK